MIYIPVKVHLLPDMLDGTHLVPRGEIHEATIAMGDEPLFETTGRTLSGWTAPRDGDVLTLMWYAPDTNSLQCEDWADWETVWVAVESWTEELANEVL